MTKKYSFFFGFVVLMIAAIFTMAGCGDADGGPAGTPPPSPPVVTITGIPSEYNGKFILGASDGLLLVASISGETMNLSKVINGSVTLYPYIDGQLYTGSDTIPSGELFIAVFSISAGTEDELGDHLEAAYITKEDITFTNGKATMNWSQFEVSPVS